MFNDDIYKLDNIKTAEIKKCAFICEQNQAMLSLDNLTNLFNHIFPDSNISKNFACKRTQGNFIIKNVLGKSILEELIDKITSAFFSKVYSVM